MRDYGQIAEALGVKRTTLQSRIWKHNRVSLPKDRIEPDKIEAAGGVNRHLFNEASVAKMKTALTHKKRGPKPAKEGK